MCGIGTPEVVEVCVFLNDLFLNLQVLKRYAVRDNSFFFVSKDFTFIFKQDLENNTLECGSDGFWSILEEKYKLEYSDIYDIISYKINTMLNDSLNINSLKPMKWSRNIKGIDFVGVDIPILKV